MAYTQDELKRLHVSLGSEGSPELGIYPPNRHGGNIDDTVLMGYPRTAPDGTTQQELSIGVVLYDRIAVTFPVIDILKFALQQHPELLERAQAELAVSASA